MAKNNDESRPSTDAKLDRRAVIRRALVVGGVSAVVGAGSALSPAAAMPQGPSEREWARALARGVANQLPEAIRQARGIQLTAAQVEELRRAFENTLINNMGCEGPRR